MTRKLFLHVGYPRAGTDLLQAFLARNTATLAARGMLYPQTGRVGDGHAGVNAALGLTEPDRPRDAQRASELAEAIAAEAIAAGAQTVVISAPGLVNATQPDKVRLHQLFTGYDVRIVCYLRRHDLAFEEGYVDSLQAAAVQPWTDSIHGYIVYHLGVAALSYEYLNVLRQWVAAFGAGAVLVRPCEPAQNSPDLAADFLATIGVADTPDLVRPPHHAPVIGPRTAAAIRLVRATALDEPRKQRVIAQLVDSASRAVDEGGFLTAGERDALIRRYTPMYRQIAKEFLGRDGSDLFIEKLRPSDPTQEPRRFATEDLVETVLRAVTPRPV
jgi:hypothetical protein